MVSYFTEDCSFDFKGKKRITSRWLKETAINEGRVLGQINVIFCSDPYLLDVNRKYLNHNFYTDIITFDYCEGNVLSGDLFISVDCVKVNSEDFGTTFENELNRVIVHGLLHLIGYDDHCDEDIAMMRKKENQYLLTREKL